MMPQVTRVTKILTSHEKMTFLASQGSRKLVAFPQIPKIFEWMPEILH